MERYKEIVGKPAAYRAYVDEMKSRYPELFPSEIVNGYRLHDQRRSKKMPEIQVRRIKLPGKEKDQVYTIVPSGVMPYMTGYTDDVEKPLFLRKFNVPFWALSYVFGKNDAYWYRVASHFGRYDIVQTTVKDAKKLPDDWLSDEKHTYFNGEKAYIAITVAQDCVFGASISLTADTDGLTEAYGHVQQEILHLKPDYEPKTVNTDGWAATQNAWRSLFPSITLIECFLHAFIKIRNCCQKRFQEVYTEICQQVWDIYHADDADTFQKRVTDLQQWAQKTITGAAFEAIEKLCAKTDRFLLTFEYPKAYRTSNMIDRHMDPMDRWLFSSRYFHGHLSSAERLIRAWALLHNFWPFSSRAKVRLQFRSPAHKLNDFVYHDNWLHNLLISSSIAGST
jgi:hypothetical protein